MPTRGSRSRDRDDLTYDEKLAGYRALADDYFERERYEEFCDAPPGRASTRPCSSTSSAPTSTALLVDTVRATFPPHEHDHFVAHYRGLLGAWARDERARLG